MLKRTACLFALLLIGVVIIATSAPVRANDDIEDGKTYRVVRTNGKEVVGEVTELGNVYKVKVASGITVTLKKSEVREIISLESEQPAAIDVDHRRLAMEITDAEIEQILGDESVEDLYVWEYIEQVDLMEPLELDEESVRIMERYAGREGKRLITPHFVFVYTSSPGAARRLAARLETVYKWNVTFMRLFAIPPKKPDSKLEVFYFNTYEEYGAYQTLNGFKSMGALGFYYSLNNRCAFFDMNTWPPVAAALAGSTDTSRPYKERMKLKNEYKRWSDWMNIAVVQHEATHSIQFNIGIFPQRGNIGKWMIEGLCVQFEVAPSITGGSLGSINYSRLDDWHKMYGRKGERVPWTFVKNQILSNGMGYHDYVMGWAINYYLRKEFRDEYAEWMQLMAAREDDFSVRINTTQRLADFENLFGKVDEEWVQEMFDYIAAIPMRESAIVRDPRNP